MRISAGADRRSRNGGNIHVHSEIPFITIRPRIKGPIRQSIPLAPLEIGDAVFQELIRISSASNYMEFESIIALCAALRLQQLKNEEETYFNVLSAARSSSLVGRLR